MRSITRVLVAGLLATGIAAGPIGAPASAADVAVGFQVSAGTAAPPGVPLSDCAVSVPSGANGVAVLDAAEAKGCIDSYSGSNTEFGYFLECVNGICGTAVTYWALYLDDTFSNVGLSSYEARAGDEVEVSYQTWLACQTPLGCDPVSGAF